jgi:predicted metalloprotease with PDZ domain
VTVMSLTPELRTHFGAPDDRGVLVAHVEPGAPVAAAGIAVGDVIVSVQGQKIGDAPDVLAALANLGKGQPAKIELVRDGKTRAIDATLTNDASTSTSWREKWLDDWTKSFLEHQALGAPFVEPFWLPDVPKPPAQPKHASSDWLQNLRQRFRVGPRCLPS